MDRSLRPLRTLQAHVADILRAAQSQAVGGGTWTVTDAAPGAGTGITGPRAATPAGTVTAAVVEVDLTKQGTSRSEARVPVRQWQLLATLEQLAVTPEADGLYQGREITSVLEPARQFRIATIDTSQGLALCVLEVIR